LRASTNQAAGINPTNSRHVSASWKASLIAALSLAPVSAGGCSEDRSSIRAPEYERPAILGRTSSLRLVIELIDSVITNRDSLLIQYHLQNTDTLPQTYRDVPEFYYFYVINPDGHWAAPIANSERLASGRVNEVTLRPGESSEKHVLNLACMAYHPVDFEPRFKSTRKSQCMLEYRLKVGGRYAIVGQRVPPGGWSDNVSSERPSKADTVVFEYRPKWRLWH
jgi:hypothetical protein